MAYTPEQREELFTKIFSAIENGDSLRKALASVKLSSKTFYEWLDYEGNEEKVKQYAIILNSLKLKGKKFNSSIKGNRSKDVNDYRKINARNTNKEKFPNSSIYIFEIKDMNLFKIGVSNNVYRRFRDIESSSPFSVNLLFEKKLDNTYDLEETIHNYFSDKHVKSEWFQFNSNEIEDVYNIIDTYNNFKLEENGETELHR